MGSFLNVTVQLLYWQLLTCVTAYILIEGAHNVWSIEAAVCGPIEVNCLTLTGISTMLSIPFISVILETLVKQEDLTAAQKGPKVESTPYNICVYECWCLVSCTCVRDAAGKRAQFLLDICVIRSLHWLQCWLQKYQYMLIINIWNGLDC